MSFHQLDPAIPLHVIGKGDGYAFAAIDYAQEHNLIWVTAINATGEIWCAPNPKVRLLQNWSMGRALHRENGSSGAASFFNGSTDASNFDVARGVKEAS